MRGGVSEISSFVGVFFGLPHVRGGVSFSGAHGRVCEVSSPRAWGCFPDLSVSRTIRVVFPTCVGVFLPMVYSFVLSESLPHVRGGVSNFNGWLSPEMLSSPRAWGCFYEVVTVD